MEIKESKELSLCIVFRKNKRQIFFKYAKYPTLGPFLPKFGRK